MTDIQQIFRTLDRELWVVTAQAGGRRGGLIATTVSQASIVPDMPRVLVGIAMQHHTWRLIEESRAFTLHLLRGEQLDWVWQFGSQSGRDADKFAGLSVRAAASGSPLLPDALAWLDCSVEASLDTGDRTVYLAKVLDCGQNGDEPPLTARAAFARATPEQLQQLRTQQEADAAVDAAAIAAWRQRVAGKGE